MSRFIIVEVFPVIKDSKAVTLEPGEFIAAGPDKVGPPPERVLINVDYIESIVGCEDGTCTLTMTGRPDSEEISGSLEYWCEKLIEPDNCCYCGN